MFSSAIILKNIGTPQIAMRTGRIRLSNKAIKLWNRITLSINVGTNKTIDNQEKPKTNLLPPFNPLRRKTWR